MNARPWGRRLLRSDQPTFAERLVLAGAFWARLEPAIAALGQLEAPVRLERMRLFETHEYFVELERER